MIQISCTGFVSKLKILCWFLLLFLHTRTYATGKKIPYKNAVASAKPIAAKDIIATKGGIFAFAAGFGRYDSSRVIFNMAPPNQPPVAAPDTTLVQEETPATGNVLTNDRDPEGDALTASLVTAPVQGTVVLNADGSFTYTPNTDFYGADSLIYQVCDNGRPSYCDTATLIFNVVNANDPPVAVRDSFTVAEDHPLSGNVLANDMDVDGDPLSVSLITGPAHGRLALRADGNFTYTPSANYSGTDSLVYRLCDTGPRCDTATVIFTITADNDAPVAVRDTLAVQEDIPGTGNVLTNDTDAEGNALTASLVTAPVEGTVVLNADGSFTYTPNADFHGADSLIYQVCDNGRPSYCDTATLILNVINVNDPPVAVKDSFTIAEDHPLSGNVLANDVDVDSDTLSVSLITGPAHGRLALRADGNFTYTPSANYSGTDSLVYQLCDTGPRCDTATVIFTITADNDAPVAVRDTLTVQEDIPGTGNVLTNDTDAEGNALTASLVTAPVEGTVVLNADGSFTYTPNADFHGADSLIYQVCDNGRPSYCDTATLILNVIDVNDAPVAVRDSFTIAEDHPLSGNVLANDVDVDSDTLNVSLITGPANGRLALRADGNFTYTPNANYSGTDSLVYQLCDTGPRCDTATVIFTITADNDAPVAVRDTLAVQEDIPGTGNVLTNDTDAEGNALTASLVTAPVQGTVVLNADGSFTYTPNAGLNGADSLIYQVCDNGTPSLCDTATLLFNVGAVNDKPVAWADTLAVQEDIPATGNVLTNDTDPDNDPLSASPVKQPENGNVILNGDGSFTYTPNANYNGVDSFIYKICDSGPLCDTATVLLNITAINDKPVALADTFAVTEDMPVTGNVLTNDTDPDSDALTVSPVTPPVNGKVTLNADGSFTYTPAADFNGADSMVYSACDPSGACASAKVTFNVAAVNDAPIAQNDSLGTVQETPVTGNVLLNDTDLENNTLTASVLTATANGTLQLNSNGSFTYTPSDGFTGMDEATYRACDAGACDTALLVFTVAPPPESPVIGAAMTVDKPAYQADGAYRATFTIRLRNYGDTRLLQVKAIDNLPGAFPAPASFRVVSVHADAGLIVNSAFNGVNDSSLLAAGSTLEVGETGTITLVTDIIPNGNFGPFNNRATAHAVTPLGKTVNDISSEGINPDPNGNGNPGDTGEDTPTPVDLEVKAVAGLAKAASEPVLEISGDYTVRYTLVLRNMGNVPITGVQVTDDISRVFTPPATFTIAGDITATGDLLPANSFNGSNNISLLAPGSKLAAGANDTITLAVRITPNKQSGTFNNSASLTAVSLNGVDIRDESTNGLEPDPDGNGMPDESEVTPVTLMPTRLHIPEGFSPNGDGKNDRFVIGNAGNDKISLEVFNRWGNAVYKNSDYKNTWDGKCNQGLHLGDDVAAGTYYYIITVNSSERFASFITIMR